MSLSPPEAPSNTLFQLSAALLVPLRMRNRHASGKVPHITLTREKCGLAAYLAADVLVIGVKSRNRQN